MVGRLFTPFGGTGEFKSGAAATKREPRQSDRRQLPERPQPLSSGKCLDL